MSALVFDLFAEAFALPPARRVRDRRRFLPLVRAGGLRRRQKSDVGGPFPHVADHVEQPVAVRFVGPYWSGRQPAIVRGVVRWNWPCQITAGTAGRASSAARRRAWPSPPTRV